MSRLRRGKGFSYRDAKGATVVDVVVDVKVKDRIAKIAIPPAWRNVWICTWPDGHILAVGDDERGRRQYIYHERWRSLRDQLNFYRLLGFGDALPPSGPTSTSSCAAARSTPTGCSPRCCASWTSRACGSATRSTRRRTTATGSAH